MTVLNWIMGKNRPQRMERCVRLFTSRIQTLEEMDAAPARIAATLRRVLAGRSDVPVAFERVTTEAVILVDGPHARYYVKAQDIQIWVGGSDADQIVRYIRAETGCFGIMSRHDSLAVRRVDFKPYSEAEWALPCTLLGDYALQSSDDVRPL